MSRAEITGQCHELSVRAVEEDPDLTLVRGWYHCSVWGRREHWWTTLPDGTIHDPTVAQFPSGGLGAYEPFAGTYPCEECGLDVPEDQAVPNGHHMFCSNDCLGRCVGLL